MATVPTMAPGHLCHRQLLATVRLQEAPALPTRIPSVGKKNISIIPLFLICLIKCNVCLVNVLEIHYLIKHTVCRTRPNGPIFTVLKIYGVRQIPSRRKMPR